MRAYDDRDLVRYFRESLRAFRDEPGNAFGRRVAERTVTQRIAMHLQPRIQELQVDCEYNRNGGRPKYIDVQHDHLTPSERQHQIETATRGRAKATRLEIEQWSTYRVTSSPDILVHQRGTNDHNLLIVEVKIVGDRRGADGESLDMAKLRAFTLKNGPYHYQLGLFVVVSLEGETIRFFRNGGEIEEAQL